MDSYGADFVKQVQKAARAKPCSATTTTSSAAGEPLLGDDPVLSHLLKLSSMKGWHARPGLGINVAKGARSLRTPEPRFSSDSLPYTTTFGCFEVGDQLLWPVLERGIKYCSLPNTHALIGPTAHMLVTVFHAEPDFRGQDAGLAQLKEKDPC